MYKKLSNGISWVLHPFLLPLYLIVVLLTLTVFAHYPANVKFYLLWVVVLYAMIIPLLALGVLRSLGRISDFKIDNRRERLLPLLVGLIGVYNINKGYADFKQIQILYQNDEYSIVKSNTEYGLNVYDYIALNAEAVTVNDFIYE